MLRSMNSAISGLKNHQVFMDVIGNNISNVNTTGFKGSRVTFQTMLSQTLRGAVSPAVGRGGINTAQVGLGSAIASIDMVNTQGTMSTTGKTTDLAIQGDGFFVMTDGFRKYFTRDGSFDLDAESALISPATGLRVMGWTTSTDASGNVTINNAIPPTSPLKLPIGQSVTAKASTALTFTGNLNGAATDRMGSGVVESTTCDAKMGFSMTNDSITFTYNGRTFTTSATLNSTADTTSMSTIATCLQNIMNAELTACGITDVIQVGVVDDAGTLPGEAIFSFQAPKSLKFGNSASSNSSMNTALKGRDSKGLESMTTTITVYDSLGNGHNINIRFDKVTSDATGVSTADLWKWTLTNLDAGTTVCATSGNGAGSGYVRFDTAGKFASVNTVSTDGTSSAKPSTATATFDYTNGAANGQTVTLDFGQLTQLQDGDTANASLNDGFGTGTLLSIVIGQHGVISGAYTNGTSQVLGQVAMATFANIAGLNHISQNMFVESANSGLANIGSPNSGSRGQINSGQLEVSNVDLAVQFTDMIRAERGFQANSRIITTSDEMLQDLVNLKR